MAYSKQRDLGSTKGTDNDALLNRLCKRYDRLKETLYLWEPTWQDLADLVMPRKGTITQRTQESARLTQRLRVHGGSGLNPGGFQWLPFPLRPDRSMDHQREQGRPRRLRLPHCRDDGPRSRAPLAHDLR